jgi:hypothetical protein
MRTVLRIIFCPPSGMDSKCASPPRMSTGHRATISYQVVKGEKEARLYQLYYRKSQEFQSSIVICHNRFCRVIPESIDYELTGSRSIRTGECRSLVDLQRRFLIPMINVMNPVENVEQRLDVDVFQIDDISPISCPLLFDACSRIY